MTHRRTTLALVATAAAVSVVAACGTQLPDKRFQSQPVTIAASPAGDGGTTGGDTSGTTGGDTSTTGDTSTSGTTGSATTGSTSGTTGTTSTSGTSGTTSTSGTTGTTSTSGTSGTTSGKTTGTTTGTSPSKAPSSASKSAGSGGANGASDVGVTATSITVGNLVSAGGIFGTEQFGSEKYGVQAFFADLNAKGGINGRKVILKTYNDNGDGSQNTQQVNQAIDTDKVMAFVGNNVYKFDGAATVSAKDVPDFGGNPIDNVYYKYPHLYNILGYNGPLNGNTFGWSNNNYANPDYASYFQSLGVKHVGVVYYDQASSQRGASVVGLGFKQLGITVTDYAVNLGLPNFSNTVAQMQADGVDLVADAMDSNGNSKLCGSMESNNAFLSQVKGKVSTIANWSQRVPSEYKQTPKCRALLYSTGSDAAYSLTSNPEVATFRAAMKKYFPQRESLMSQWTFEGWLAGELFTEAAKSCGADLTRKCIETYITRPGYVFDPQNSTTGFAWDQQPESNFKGKTKAKVCSSVVHWSESQGTFVSVSDPQTGCYSNLPYYSYVLS